MDDFPWTDKLFAFNSERGVENEMLLSHRFVLPISELNKCELDMRTFITKNNDTVIIVHAGGKIDVWKLNFTKFYKI